MPATQQVYGFHGSYEFLSNFYPAPIVDGADQVWPTAEHLYQAMKSTDVGVREQIRNAATPSVAKSMGRKVVLRPNWEAAKVSVMRLVVSAKFTQHHALAVRLVATAPTELVEVNYWHDNEWGSCICRDCHLIDGLNLLGKVLMEIREEISQP